MNIFRGHNTTILFLIFIIVGSLVKLHPFLCLSHANILNTRLLKRLTSNGLLDFSRSYQDNLQSRYKRLTVYCNCSERYYKMMGVISLHSNNYADAQKYFETALKSNPNNLSPALFLVNIYRSNSDWESLIDLDYRIGFTNDLRRISDEGLKIGQYQLTRSALLALLRIDPYDGWVYYRIALSYVIENRLDEGQKWFEMGIVKSPNYPWLYIGLGGILNKKGRFTEALKIYKIAIELEPDNSYFYQVLGIFCFENEDYKNARIYFEKADLIKKNDPTIKRYLATLHWLSGENIEAVINITKAFVLDPEDETIRNQLTEYYCDISEQQMYKVKLLLDSLDYEKVIHTISCK